MLREQLQRYNKLVNNAKKCNKISNYLGKYLVNKKNFVFTNGKRVVKRRKWNSLQLLK